VDAKEIKKAVFEALNKHKAYEIDLLKSKIQDRDKIIEILNTELSKYQNACIELDNAITKKENELSDLIIENKKYNETIDKYKIEKKQLLSDLDYAQNGVLINYQEKSFFEKIAKKIKGK